MRTQERLRQLWGPPQDALEAIAAVLSARWRAAAKAYPARLFRPAPTQWLQTPKLAPLRITISPGVANSSGTRRGLRQY
jgi:hypothetical protein